MAATATAEKPVARDVRIDQIGFAEELSKQFTKINRSKVTGRMLEETLTEVEGDFFHAILAGVDSERGVIDPVKVFRLIKAGKLKEGDFLSCIRVDRSKLEEFLSGKEIDRMSEFKAGTPSLRVTRKPGVEIKLVDALKELGKIIAA